MVKFKVVFFYLLYKLSILLKILKGSFLRNIRQKKAEGYTKLWANNQIILQAANKLGVSLRLLPYGFIELKQMTWRWRSQNRMAPVSRRGGSGRVPERELIKFGRHPTTLITATGYGSDRPFVFARVSNVPPDDAPRSSAVRRSFKARSYSVAHV